MMILFWAKGEFVEDLPIETGTRPYVSFDWKAHYVFPCIVLTPFEPWFVAVLLITVYYTDSVDLSLWSGCLLSCFCCPFSRVSVLHASQQNPSPFLLRYLLCLTLISPIAHSNISRGVREIFLYPIRDYSLGGKQILCVQKHVCGLSLRISVTIFNFAENTLHIILLYIYNILYIYNNIIKHKVRISISLLRFWDWDYSRLRQWDSGEHFGNTGSYKPPV